MDLRNLVWGNFLAKTLRCWLMRVHRGILGNKKDGEERVERLISAAVFVCFEVV